MISHVRIETPGHRVQKHDSVTNRQEVEQNRADTVVRSCNGEFPEDRWPARLVTLKGKPISVSARIPNVPEKLHVRLLVVQIATLDFVVDRDDGCRQTATKNSRL